MIGVTLDSDHNGVVEYKSLTGEVITTDPETFFDYLKTNHPAWMKGVDSSGGLNSAAQPAASGGKVSDLSREDFEKLNPGQKGQFLSNGGKIK